MADKDTEMALKQPKELARKLAKTDISGMVVGDTAKAGIKKFGDKHPVLISKPEMFDDAESENTFNAANIKKEKSTRRADYQGDESEKAYEAYAPIKKRIVEKFVKKSVNAQKQGALTSHDAVKGQHEGIEAEGTAGDDTHEKLKSVVAKEENLMELGEPMSPAPATSDNPGWSGSATSGPDASAQSQSKDADSDDSDNDDEDENENVGQAKDYLETIAMDSAELFENLQDDSDIPSWALEKLQLAADFVASVKQHVSEGGDEDGEDEEEGNQGSSEPAGKPSAFKGGETAMAKEETSYSAQAARAGKDIGKPGKNFAKIAKDAAKRYGSKESGERVAGAVLAKLRNEEVKRSSDPYIRRITGTQTPQDADTQLKVAKANAITAKSLRDQQAQDSKQIPSFKFK